MKLVPLETPGVSVDRPLKNYRTWGPGINLRFLERDTRAGTVGFAFGRAGVPAASATAGMPRRSRSSDFNPGIGGLGDAPARKQRPRALDPGVSLYRSGVPRGFEPWIGPSPTSLHGVMP